MLTIHNSILVWEWDIYFYFISRSHLSWGLYSPKSTAYIEIEATKIVGELPYKFAASYDMCVGWERFE